MTYLIDANVLIEAKNKYYHMDFCPGFWDWIVHRAADGRIASIRSVYDELIIGNDELKDWAVHNSHIFLPASDTLTQRNLAEVVAYIARQQVEVPMSVGAMDEFLRGADSWLIAKALSIRGIVVTHERLDVNCKRKFLIPNICTHFNIQYMNTFDMLLQLQASFVLAV